MRDINNLLGCIGDFYIPFQGNDIHVIGTLTRYDENISLECRTDQGGTVLFESKGYHQIYGNIAGTDVTLLGSHISRMRLCGTNISQTILTITPSAIVLGRSSKEKIKAISSNMKDFNQMFADSALTSNILFTRENPSLVQFAFPENITATDNDGELTIKRSFDLSQRHDGIEIQITPHINFTFNTPVEIKEALSKIYSVRDLFAFFANHYLPINSLSFSDDKSSNESDDCLDCEIILNSVEDIKTPDSPFLINAHAFEGSFQNIWNNWLLFNKENKHISTLFFEVISNHSTRTNRFLNLCQCLEVYSNHHRNNQAKLIRDKHTPPNTKKSKITLSHRLEDLFLYTNEYLMLEENKCIELATTIGNSRNFFTHYNEKRYNEPSFDCIACSCRFLHFVLLLIIYKALGIPDDYILACKERIPFKNMELFISNIV